MPKFMEKDGIQKSRVLIFLLARPMKFICQIFGCLHCLEDTSLIVLGT